MESLAARKEGEEIESRIRGVSMQHGGIGKIPTFKVILLGSSSVGKSSLLRRFVDNQFISEAEATISKNEMSKVI